MAVETRMLVVGRDRDLGADLRPLLEDMTRIRPRFVGDLDEAATALELDVFEIILVLLDGVDVRRRIRAWLGDVTRLLPALPVLVVSGCYDEEEAAGLFHAGIADYLSRDDHLDRFAAVIECYAGSSPFPAFPVACPVGKRPKRPTPVI